MFPADSRGMSPSSALRDLKGGLTGKKYPHARFLSISSRNYVRETTRTQSIPQICIYIQWTNYSNLQNISFLNFVISQVYYSLNLKERIK